jgi:hypothetical protein
MLTVIVKHTTALKTAAESYGERGDDTNIINFYFVINITQNLKKAGYITVTVNYLWWYRALCPQLFDVKCIPITRSPSEANN